jgi:REP element-mobilizing transposase RayT
MKHYSRKTTRLPNYGYSCPGYYFVTLCTKNKCKILGEVVGTGLLDGPKVQLSSYGETANKQLALMADFYDTIKVEKYIVMPNHIHLLLYIAEVCDGPSGRATPTNSEIAKFVGTFKRFCNRQYGENIWQMRSHNHVIRGERDYQKIWSYIEHNAAKWQQDCFYVD